MLYYNIPEADMNYLLLTEEKNKASPDSDTLKTSEASSCSQFCSSCLSIIMCFYYSLSICHMIPIFLIFGSQSTVYCFLMGGLQLLNFCLSLYFYCLPWYHHPFCFTWKANTWASSEKCLVSLLLWLNNFSTVHPLEIWEVFLVPPICSNVEFFGNLVRCLLCRCSLSIWDEFSTVKVCSQIHSLVLQKQKLYTSGDSSICSTRRSSVLCIRNTDLCNSTFTSMCSQPVGQSEYITNILISCEIYL